MTISFPALYILIILGLTNLAAFLVMLIDKLDSSRPGAERISEGMMFLLAAAFGSLGIYLGMFAFRHKTRKWYFLLGIPLLMLENAATAYLIFLALGGHIDNYQLLSF
ncbi:MAG: DUF1294 domain-containing protein [Patescibacteria group bacterium]